MSVGLVAVGFACFALAVRYLPIFPARGHGPGALAASEEPSGSSGRG